MSNISGYRELTADEIDTVNIIKEWEENLGIFWRQVMEMETTDKRWASIAKTGFEEAFMAFVRSVTRPTPRF
jgi:beta-mannanase